MLESRVAQLEELVRRIGVCLFLLFSLFFSFLG